MCVSLEDQIDSSKHSEYNFTKGISNSIVVYICVTNRTFVNDCFRQGEHTTIHIYITERLDNHGVASVVFRESQT